MGESPVEIVAVVVADHAGDFADPVAGVRQELLGPFHPKIGQIGIQGLPGLALEEGAEVGDGEVGIVGDVLDGERGLAVMLPDIASDQIDGLVFGLLRGEVLEIRPDTVLESPVQVIQAEAGIDLIHDGFCGIQ